LTDQPGPDWAQIRQRYEETQDRVADICRDAGIAERDLVRARKKGQWRRQHPRPFPPPRKALAAVRKEEDAALASGGPETDEAKPDTGSTEDACEPVPGNPASTSPAAAAPAIPRRLLATPAARRRLLERLVAAISMKLEQLERRMSIDLAKGEDLTATDHERETRAIGALIDNLEKIRELEAGLAPNVGKSGSATTDLADEADRCRRELAERLSRLVGAAARGP
jgi:transposase-like protein